MLDVTEFHSFFGRRLRTVRKVRNLTVEDMVFTIRAVDPSDMMSTNYYRMLENGTAKASTHLTFLLAHVLKCSIYDFIPPQQGEPILDDETNKLAVKLKAIEDIIRA